MKIFWTEQELIENFTFIQNELDFLKGKTKPSQMGFAVLLKFFALEGKFPRCRADIPQAIVVYIAEQINIPFKEFDKYKWQGRTIEFHRSQIRNLLNFKAWGQEHRKELIEWLKKSVIAKHFKHDQVKAEALTYLRNNQIEPPANDSLERIVSSAKSGWEEKFFRDISRKIARNSRLLIDTVLSAEISGDKNIMSFREIKSDPNNISVKSIKAELYKLENIEQIGLPPHLLKGISVNLKKFYRDRIITEPAREVRRHPEHIRYALLAIFFESRRNEIIDDLIELFIKIVKRIQNRAEKYIFKEFIAHIKKVRGKERLLFKMASASKERPDDPVKEVIFPVVDEDTIDKIIREYESTDFSYDFAVNTRIRLIYRSHYRSMLIKIIKALDFQSGNKTYNDLLRAIQILKKYSKSHLQFYPGDEQTPTFGIVPAEWAGIVFDTDRKGGERTNRIAYELCVLFELRKRLKCKEVWVEGADRFRNPDDDLPIDFEVKREYYYQQLTLPMEPEVFISDVQSRLAESLKAFDENIKCNEYVELRKKNKKIIKLSPLAAQAEPENLGLIKNEINKKWRTVSLLDVLKEADLRINFTRHFKSVGQRESIDPAILRKRLLLSIYAMGTNAGIKRIASGNHGEKHSDLAYVQKRFMRKECFRDAIASVVNHILESRQPHIWGDATTACASDSKQFGAWDQNILTEWHNRYGGRGIMIYWHVEKEASCIYSQLKTCSSSEVASMIEGVIRHCTRMNVEKQYVDTHGQSLVAFAFCHLLGFKLMPRFKSIHSKKLYRAFSGKPQLYPNLQPVLTRPVRWDLIAQQYDQMVKFATAVLTGSAETESILRRFTKEGRKHPTYRAFEELGRADRTIFLCHYLMKEEVRREIHGGLNIIELWNYVNDFIMFGKGGEFATNRKSSRELIMLSLHLLQNCMVYINTLMIQQVLSGPEIMQKMTAKDFRGLNPLFFNHINPYGNFELDMNARIPIKADFMRVA